MEYREILYEVRGPAAVITLNRPDHLNAFTVRMAREMMDAFDRTDADDAVRGVVVTGAGRAFCAGADLSAGGSSFDMAAMGDQAAAQGAPEGSSGSGSWPILGEGDQRAPADPGGVTVLRIHRSLKPVIAAINGSAVGVGVTMTLPMDLRLVVEGAKLGLVFNRRGINIESAASWFLPRIVGVSQALEWVNSGRLFRPDEALAGGLVRSVHPDRDALLDTAFALVDEIAAETAPVSVAVSRRLMWDAMTSGGPEDAHRRESVALARRGAAGDVKEGVTAFVDKRSPQFPDRVSDSTELTDPPR